MCLLMFFGLGANHLLAQQAINVAGHSATINGMRFDYSIGEMTLISTSRNQSLIVTQGLLQPTNTNTQNSQSSPATVHDALTSEIKVYPNPTDNILFVESNEAAAISIVFKLFDASGKVILSENADWHAGSNKITLDMRNYAAGAYYLMISKPERQGQTTNLSYKIQKTN